MPKIIAIQTRNNSDSLLDFVSELNEKHKNEANNYSKPLLNAIALFEEFGPMINYYYPKKSPFYKNLNSIYQGLGEIRTNKCRYFIFDTKDEGIWIGLHGYEKQSQDIPRNEIIKAKGEIQLWKENYLKTSPRQA